MGGVAGGAGNVWNVKTEVGKYANARVDGPGDGGGESLTHSINPSVPPPSAHRKCEVQCGEYT